MAEYAHITRRGAFVAMPALLTTAAHAQTSPHPDAELIALSDKLDHAWAAEKRANQTSGVDIDPFCDAASAIVELIEATPAVTMAGVMVKVKAFNWCRDDIGDWEDATTDMRLAEQIIETLGRL